MRTNKYEIIYYTLSGSSSILLVLTGVFTQMTRTNRRRGNEKEKSQFDCIFVILGEVFVELIEQWVICLCCCVRERVEMGWAGAGELPPPSLWPMRDGQRDGRLRRSIHHHVSLPHTLCFCMQVHRHTNTHTVSSDGSPLLLKPNTKANTWGSPCVSERLTVQMWSWWEVDPQSNLLINPPIHSPSPCTTTSNHCLGTPEASTHKSWNQWQVDISRSITDSWVTYAIIMLVYYKKHTAFIFLLSINLSQPWFKGVARPHYSHSL